MSIGGLSFTWHEFRYDMAYMVDDNKTLRITATHVTEFLRWSTTIINRLNESSSEYIKVSFTTKNLLKLFSHFMRDTLSDRHKIVMPETYTYGYDDIVQRPIRIEIHSTMEYQDEWDIKYIQLDPVSVSMQERFDLKLAQRDKMIKTLIERIDKLELAKNSQNGQDGKNIDASCANYTTVNAYPYAGLGLAAQYVCSS